MERTTLHAAAMTATARAATAVEWQAVNRGDGADVGPTAVEADAAEAQGPLEAVEERGATARAVACEAVAAAAREAEETEQEPARRSPWVMKSFRRSTLHQRWHSNLRGWST